MVNDTPASLSAIAGQYSTVVSRVVSTGAAWQRCLEMNPKRWHVSFATDSPGLAQQFVLPGGAQELTIPGGGTNLPFERKFRDAPSDVIGEWYMSLALGENLYITECIYNGR